VQRISSETLSQTMTEACTFNNQAALLIEKKEYERSIKLLHASLLLTRTSMVTFGFMNNPSGATEPQGQKELGGSNLSSEDYFCRFLFCKGGPSLESCFLTTGHVASSQLQKDHHASSSSPENGRVHSMFGSPVLFNPVIQLSDQPSLECFSYVLIYNLALAHHGMAIQQEAAARSSHRQEEEAAQQAQIQSYQQKALILYEKSHCILSRVCANYEDFLVLHPLAVLCNLGHLHHSMGNESHSEACYQSLLTVICYIVDTRGARRGYASSPQGGNDDAFILTTNLLDGFFDNVMQILQMKGRVAAAAA
jgi:hypothetical protein